MDEPSGGRLSLHAETSSTTVAAAAVVVVVAVVVAAAVYLLFLPPSPSLARFINCPQSF